GSTMKIDDLKQSNRVEDRRGQSGPSFGGSSYGGSSMGGLLLQLLFSRGKGKWFIIAIILFGLFAGGGNIGDLIGLNSSQTAYEN
ncbi:KPN_02809 family neutral zinc metallopeptidase, partial [Streptococcus pyogenes]